MGLPLVTLEQYKAYQNISSTNQDTEISTLIPGVSELVKSYCRNTFVDFLNDAKTEVFSGGSTTSKFYLKEYPIVSVSSVEYSSDYGQNYTSLTEFTDYAVDVEDNSIIALPYSEDITLTSVFAKAINGYKITYNAGYETLPDDLTLAILDLITYYLKDNAAIHSPKAPGSNRVQIEYVTKADLPAHIARVLHLYKASWD